MKTKKEILNWYEERGKNIKGLDDWRDFWHKIEPSVIQKIISKKRSLDFYYNDIEVILLPKRCKIPVRLYFYKHGVYRIVY